MSSVGPRDDSFLKKSFAEAAIEVLGEEAAKRLPAFYLKTNPRLKYFLTLFKRPTFTPRPRAPKGENGKICIECRVEKPYGDFNQRQADCKVCEKERRKAYGRTVWGSLMAKIAHARHSDKAKDATMRANGIKNFLDGTPISPEYIGEFVKRHKGLCAYWNGPIDFEDVRSWSIERVDNDKGHLVGNVCIVDSRFQSADHSGKRAPGECAGSSQWSRKKFLLAAKLRQEPAPVPVYVEKPPIKRRRIDREYDDKGNLKCLDCGEFLGPESFCGPRRNCRDCKSLADCARGETLEAFLAQRLTSAYQRTTEHNEKAKKNPDLDPLPECNLDVDYLLAVWQIQEQICDYTDLPMTHIPQSNWVASLEKLTPENGYVQGNVAWVVNEANTAYQWSRAFAKEIWGPSVRGPS